MKIIKVNKQIILIIIIVFGIFFVIQSQRFPVKYKICDTLYQDCSVDAKFKDFRSCEKAKEMGNWYCNSEDKNNISCREAKAGESSVVSVCTK